MNYNDKIITQQGMIMNTQESDFYQNEILKESTQSNKIMIRSKKPNQKTKKFTSMKGKQNQLHNINLNNNKNLVTNHSFNGFFNQNTKPYKNQANQSVQSSLDPTEIANQNNKIHININSPTNFNSSGKLSNLHFVNDSINKSQQIPINPQVKIFMKKYFPLNFQTCNYYGQYVTLEDFVEIILQEFEQLFGENSFNLIDQFADKILRIFGDKIYFQDLFQKTAQNGLTGIVFQALKAIQQDKKPKRQLIAKQNKNLQKSIIAQQFMKDSRLQKSKVSQGFNGFKSKVNISNINHQPLIMMDRSNSTTKISLDKYFGSSCSKVQFYEDTTGVSEQNLQQIKQILQDYIQNMYEEAQAKLNKKYAQQIKKISLKYKQTQKLMQKINEKISNHYDSIQLEKDYQKKLKLMADKQNQLNQKIKDLQYELKLSKDQAQKQKLNTFKINQQLQKTKQKLQKYENAIFEKAMQKSNMQNNDSKITNENHFNKSNNQTHTNISNISQLTQKPIENTKFQIRVDTFSEHRPALSPIKSSIPTYTSYFTKQSFSPITVKKPDQIQRGSSVSPIKQRINFVKTQNPNTQARVQSPNNEKQMINSTIETNINPMNTPNLYANPSPYYYASSISNTSISNNNTNGNNSYYRSPQTQSSISGNSRLKISNVQKMQVGEPIHLRPLSPIGKLGDNNNRNYSQNAYTDSQRPYSPIRVQFCNSRVNTINQ